MGYRGHTISAGIEQAPEKASNQRIIRRVPPRTIDMAKRVAEFASADRSGPVLQQTIEVGGLSNGKDRRQRHADARR
jgi:hypothetical protein